MDAEGSRPVALLLAQGGGDLVDHDVVGLGVVAFEAAEDGDVHAGVPLQAPRRKGHPSCTGQAGGPTMEGCPMTGLQTTLRRQGTALGRGALSLLLGCATNPATGKRQIALICEQQEIAMGRETDQQVQQQLGLYPDPRAPGLRQPGRPEARRGVRAPEPALDLPGGGRPGGQRVRPARRLHLRDAGPDDPSDLGGRAGLGARARDRPRHRPPQRGADEQAAARPDRPHRRGDPQPGARQLRRSGPPGLRSCS